MYARGFLTREVAVALLASALCASAHADVAAIIGRIAEFFRTDDAQRRVEIARQIEQDPDYSRENVRTWLHKADLFGPRSAGRHELHIALPDGSTRNVVLRVPEGYDSSRPWPLIYALHGTGGNGDGMINYFTHVLGDAADSFILAAPTGYRDLIIHQAEWPPTNEHRIVLREVRKSVHVDSDRIYISGYSLGGHTTWTVAVLCADEFAGAMPLAGTFTLLLIDKMWDTFLPNVQHLPIFGAWGAGDIYDNDGKVGTDGGIAGTNRRLIELAKKMGVPVTGYEDPERGHGNVVPPRDEMMKLLSQRRVHWPAKVEHSFRHICQASAYWIEGHEWRGDQWDDKRRVVHIDGGRAISDDEIDERMLHMFRGLLGELRGEIDGQTISVRRKNVGVLTVWIGDGMIDWDEPVTLRISGRRVFQGKLEPSLYVALSQAARTRDFDRLRWAGVRFQSGRKTEPVGPETEFLTLEEIVKPKD